MFHRACLPHTAIMRDAEHGDLGCPQLRIAPLDRRSDQQQNRGPRTALPAHHVCLLPVGSCGLRFDVLIIAEHILRIVLPLDHLESREVGAVGRLNPAAFFLGHEIHICTS